MKQPNRISLLKRAIPIMGANIATPVVGLVDLAVIGNTGTIAAIGAVAIGTLVFNILFYAFGFLRMGSTALVAQAEGAKKPEETLAVIGRGVVIGLLVGLGFLLIQPWLGPALLTAFSADKEIKSLALDYFNARLWGAPAMFAGLALYGGLIGMGLTARALWLQLALNLCNIVLSIWFVIGLDWGPYGLGLASGLSQWVQLLVGVILLTPIVMKTGRPRLNQFFKHSEIIKLLSVNRDIFIRTIALIAGFYWFNEASLREGADILAGNAILLQFIAISAYFLDAFAHITESEVGRAAGSRNWPDMKRSFRLTSELAFGFSLILALIIVLAGPSFIMLMTDQSEVQRAASSALIWCALVPILGWPSWQLDGLMIGITRGALLRNAMIAALAIYILLDLILRPLWGVNGLWIAFILYYVARAGTLLIGWPGLKREYQEAST